MEHDRINIILPTYFDIYRGIATMSIFRRLTIRPPGANYGVSVEPRQSGKALKILVLPSPERIFRCQLSPANSPATRPPPVPLR
jgi:hypothetical protein